MNGVGKLPFRRRSKQAPADSQVMLHLVTVDEAQGQPLARATGMDADTVYAALERLEAAGWVEHRQEGWLDHAWRDRRFYRLTDAGRTRALRG